jgi:hypothetical protein
MCVMIKMHRIVFRSSAKKETSDESFFRVTYDLMFLNKSDLNDHEWVSHFVCSIIDFNIVDSHRIKSKAIDLMKQIINLIKTRFKRKVVFFRSDDERVLNENFDDFMTQKDITYESSAFDTSIQNDHSKKKKHILIIRARAMRLKTNLSSYLWFWIYQTVNYLMNWISMIKHDWKTFYEFAHSRTNNSKKSHLRHLRKFDCKIYSLNKNLTRKNKLAVKTHLNFLIEYDNINIFLIWVLSERKMISTKNVMFDEKSFYKLNDQSNLMQLINESMFENESSFDVLELFTLIVREKTWMKRKK